MTKKILLKWLEEQKVKALAQVDTQENAAKATLLAEKLERTKFAEMVAYVEPRLTEVYDYTADRMSCRLTRLPPRTVRNTALAWRFMLSKMRSSARQGKNSKALRSIWLAMTPGQRNGLRQSPAICATE